METKIQVLDHGFVQLRNISGPTRRIFDSEVYERGSGTEVRTKDIRAYDADDTDPANTARMSFDQTDSGRTREQDLALCNYLMKHKHTTPFEMIEVWLEMKMPIFIARQFVRHRTCTINEVSGRYVQLPPEWYIPEVVGAKAENVKQGQTVGLDENIEEWFKRGLKYDCEVSYEKYLFAINNNVAPEHARMFLHLNHYTHWIWKQDLHNMMHFLSLRVDSHAQVEAQAYATAIIDLIRQQLPNSMALFDTYRRLP